MKKPFLLLVAAGFLAAGCITKTVMEPATGIETDQEALFSESEFLLEGIDSVKVVRITSNRSWSAHLNDLDNPIDESDPSQGIDWAYLSEEAHPNVTRATEVTDLLVIFRRNFSKAPRNGVLHIYSEGGLKKTISLSQAGVVYRLDATSGVKEASDEGEYIPIIVDCNTAWTAKIDPSSTADCFLAQDKGFDPSVLYLRVKENEEKVQKTVKVTISAQDCEDKVLEFTQAPTTSNLAVFETFTRLGTAGAAKALTPKVILDSTLIDPDALGKAKFYYSTSTTSFDDVILPTEADTPFPSDGFTFLPATLSPKNELYLIVLGVCDGYRKSYEKVYIQNWKFGTKYTTESSGGLTVSVDPPTIKTDYVQMDKTTDLITYSSCKGSGSMYYMLHNASKQPTVTFYMDNQSAGSRKFSKKQETTSSNPASMASETKFFDTEAEIRLEIKSGAYFWDFCYLEQFKFKP